MFHDSQNYVRDPIMFRHFYGYGDKKFCLTYFCIEFYPYFILPS